MFNRTEIILFILLMVSAFLAGVAVAAAIISTWG